MSDHDWKQVQVFLLDREGNMRRLLRGILTRMGIDKVQEFPGPTEAMAALATTMPDLVIVEADTPNGEGFRFIHALRHAGAATNPFVAAIATTWQATSPFMVRFAGSGADDILLKPFSAKHVQDRVENLVHQRKGFVVTSDYIGPDRRRAPREGQQIPLVDVPNTLRMKALGMFDRATIQDRIASALLAVNEQKVVRQGFQVAFLMQFALPGLALEPPERMAVDHILRIPHVVEDMLRRIPVGPLRMQADLYARVLQNAIDTFRQDVQTPISDSDTLRRAALGLAALTAQRTDLEALEQEVAAAVTAYRSRLDQMVQAKAQASQPASAEPGADAPDAPPDAPKETPADGPTLATGGVPATD